MNSTSLMRPCAGCCTHALHEQLYLGVGHNGSGEWEALLHRDCLPGWVQGGLLLPALALPLMRR